MRATSSSSSKFASGTYGTIASTPVVVPMEMSRSASRLIPRMSALKDGTHSSTTDQRVQPVAVSENAAEQQTFEAGHGKRGERVGAVGVSHPMSGTRRGRRLWRTAVAVVSLLFGYGVSA